MTPTFCTIGKCLQITKSLFWCPQVDVLLVKVLKSLCCWSASCCTVDHGHQVSVLLFKGCKLPCCWSRSPSRCPYTVGQFHQNAVLLVNVHHLLYCFLMSSSGFAFGQCLKVTILWFPSCCNAGQLLQVALHILSIEVSKLLYHFLRSPNCCPVASVYKLLHCSMSQSGCTVGKGQYSQYIVGQQVALLLFIVTTLLYF